MPYTINNFDGTQLKVVADGTIDRQSTTSLNLIGRLVSGYGELQQENFVWLLQNFAGTVEPVNKIQGQVWFDRSTNALKLKVYDGTEWKNISVTKSAVSAPSSTAGDFWYKSNTKQLFIGTGTGTSWTLVGPEAVEGFAETGFKAVSVLDTTNGPHLVVKMMMNGKAVAAISTSSFQIKTTETMYTDGWRELIDGFNFRGFTATEVVINTATIHNLNAPSLTVGSGLSASYIDVDDFYANTATIATKLVSTFITSGSTATNGLIEGQWSLTSGSRLASTYADLAENYLADSTYGAGHVMKFGGENEITLCDKDMDTQVAGIISTAPAYLMNEKHKGEGLTYPIAMAGRVPCFVKGKVRKGDLLVSGSGGYARSETQPKIGSVIAKAMEDYDSTEIGLIEVMVWRG